MKAAPDGVTSTAERLHKRQRKESALMFQAHHRNEGGAPAETLPPSPPTTDDSLSLRAELREHVQRLRVILPVISVSVMALHRYSERRTMPSESVLRAWHRRGGWVFLRPLGIVLLLQRLLRNCSN
jgi:hypothetical protein